MRLALPGLGAPWQGLALIAVLIPIGVVGLVTSRHLPVTVARRSVPKGALLGPLGNPTFLRLLAMMLVAGLALSATLTGLAARADAGGRPEVTGVVEAVAGSASVLGALLWPRFGPRWSWPRQMALLLAPRAVLAIGCAVHPELWTLAAALVGTGLALAPMFVVAYAAGDRESAPEHHTEASTWVTSVTNLGSSLGTAAAGWFIAHDTLGALYAVTAVLLAVETVLGVVTRSETAQP